MTISERVRAKLLSICHYSPFSSLLDKYCIQNDEEKIMVWLIEGLVEILRTVLYVALLPVVFLFLLFIAIFRPSWINRVEKK